MSRYEALIKVYLPEGKENNGEWVCKCPFHTEDTPSFNINLDKGCYNCFGCGASGSIIDFISEFDGISKEDASKKLFGSSGYIKYGVVEYVEEKKLPLAIMLKERKLFYKL